MGSSVRIGGDGQGWMGGALGRRVRVLAGIMFGGRMGMEEMIVLEEAEEIEVVVVVFIGGFWGLSPLGGIGGTMVRNFAGKVDGFVRASSLGDLGITSGLFGRR